MKRILFALLVGAFLLPANLLAQGVRVDPLPSSTVAGVLPGGAYPPLLVIPGSLVTVCGYPASGFPCTNFATTYTDATLTTACPTQTPVTWNGSTACMDEADAQGKFGFWVAAGNYTYDLTNPNTGEVTGPFAFSAGGSGGGSPGGSSGYIQYNNSGAFGGYPLSNFIGSAPSGSQTISQPAGTLLQVLYNSNSSSGFKITNTSSGAGAGALLALSNGTDEGFFGISGTGSGSPGGFLFQLNTTGGQLKFDTNAGDIVFAPNGGNINFANLLSAPCLSTDSVGNVLSTCSGGSPLTTKGDLYGFSTTNARIPVGSDGQVLTADSTQTLGVKWGAGGGMSGLTAGIFPIATSPTTIGNSLLDYGVTTSSIFTFGAPINVASTSTPSQFALTYNTSHPLIPGGSTTAVYGVDASGKASISEAGGAASAPCTPANGACAGSGGALVNITPVLTATGCTISGGQCVVGTTTSSVALSGIPATYHDLIVTIAGSNTTTAQHILNVQFDGDTGANYAYITTAATSTGSPAVTLVTPNNAVAAVILSATGMGGGGRMEIDNYAGSRVKITTSESTSYTTTPARYTFSGVWTGTSAISSMTFSPTTGSIEAGDTITIRGVN